MHGRLRGLRGHDWTGFSVDIEPETAPAGADPVDLVRQVRERSWSDEVAKTGTFELGPVPPGLATVYLQPPSMLIRPIGPGLVRLTSPGRPTRLESFDDWRSLRQGIAQVTIEEGVTLERDFDVAELLGLIVVEVWVNEVPTAGLAVELHRLLGGSVVGETDQHGRFGPLPVLSGEWTLQVSGPNGMWRHQHRDAVQVGPSAERHALVPIEVVTARVLFLDRATGEPLALRKIQLVSAAGTPSIETDADGWATLSLTPGSYGLHLGSSRHADGRGMAELNWTRQGPRDAFVSL